MGLGAFVAFSLMSKLPSKTVSKVIGVVLLVLCAFHYAFPYIKNLIPKLQSSGGAATKGKEQGGLFQTSNLLCVSIGFFCGVFTVLANSSGDVLNLFYIFLSFFS